MDFFFFFNDTATTEIYTLSLHDALPISEAVSVNTVAPYVLTALMTKPARLVYLSSGMHRGGSTDLEDRKSTRLNSSHANISYAVFCLKKKINFLLPSSFSPHDTPALHSP